MSAGGTTTATRVERLLVPATFVTSLGNSFQVTASALLVLDAERSTLAVGWLFIAVAIPQVAFSFYFGRVADRFDRRNLCVLCDVVSAAAAFALPAWLWLGGSASVAAYASNFALAIVLALFMPASNALVRERVAPARLAPFNANFEMATQAGTLLSAAAAGFLVEAYGVRPLFIFNVLTFASSAVLTLAIGRRPAVDGDEHAATADVDDERRRELAAAAAAAAAAPPPDAPLFRLGLLYAVGNVIITLSNTMLVVLVVETFDEGAGALGIIDALAGIGIMVAAATYKRLSARVANLPIVVAGYVGCAAIIAIEPINIGLLMAVIPLAGVMFGLGRVAARTLLMSSVEESRAGRVFGATNAFGLAMAAVSTALIAKLVDETHVRNGFFSLSAFVAVTVLVTAATLARRLRVPATAEPALTDVAG